MSERDEMIERAKAHLKTNRNRPSGALSPGEALKLMADFALKCIEKADAWIPVEERLPTVPNTWPVQVWVRQVLNIPNVPEHVFYDTAKFYEGEWTASDGQLMETNGLKVTHWHPLPAGSEDGSQLWKWDDEKGRR